MGFDGEMVALEMIRKLRVPVELIERRDRDLGSQMRRSACSVALNLAEGRRREGKDRYHLFRVAAGSAAETLICLWVAEAWGYIEEQPEAAQLLDRLLAITWRLTHAGGTSGTRSPTLDQ